MRPLTLDDLLPLEEFAPRRREFFESHRRYLDRYRRVRIGPRLTLVFENRQTLWFRVQDVVRIARLTDAALLQEELNLYNDLLPGKSQLHAALLIEIGEEARLQEELAPWKDLAGENLHLHLGDAAYPAQLLTSRPEDRCFGSAHRVLFHLDAEGRSLLADFAEPAFFLFNNRVYQHQSATLGEDLRQSLLDDLELSDRD